MSANVFLVSVDAEQFERTVASAIDLTEQSDRPDALSDRDSVRLWGIEAGTRNEQMFERMETDDLLLFYREEDAEYVGIGTVGETFTDDGWAANTLWDGTFSEFVYTVDSFEPVAVPARAVNRIFDYGEDYEPNGLLRVADGRVGASPEAIRVAVRRYSERHQ